MAKSGLAERKLWNVKLSTGTIHDTVPKSENSGTVACKSLWRGGTFNSALIHGSSILRACSSCISLIKSLIVESDAALLHRRESDARLSRQLVSWLKQEPDKVIPVSSTKPWAKSLRHVHYKPKAINWRRAHTAVIARLGFRSTKLITVSLADIDYGRSVDTSV